MSTIDEQTECSSSENGQPHPHTKLCAYCKETKPLNEFLRRTGKKSGKASRRGACRSCRNLRSHTEQAARTPRREPSTAEAVRTPKRKPSPSETARTRAPAGSFQRRLPYPPPKPDGPDASVLRPTRDGIIRMRGRTDKGRRWQQETDLETAQVLVREHAAVVVNRHTIRRIYTNKSFRVYILTRDRNTCYFCGEYGDTIDHLLPRARGGHTTPFNCVCACNLCNQSKADRGVDEFIASEDWKDRPLEAE